MGVKCFLSSSLYARYILIVIIQKKNLLQSMNNQKEKSVSTTCQLAVYQTPETETSYILKITFLLGKSHEAVKKDEVWSNYEY